MGFHTVIFHRLLICTVQHTKLGKLYMPDRPSTQNTILAGHRKSPGMDGEEDTISQSIIHFIHVIIYMVNIW